MEIVLSIFLGILFHEIGHFSMAVMLGRPVSSLEIGVGPTIISFQSRGIWMRIHLFPVSGFVRIAFRSRFRWKNILVSAAGPVANFLCAFIVWGFWRQFAEISLWIGIANLIPWKSSNSESDGFHILAEWRQK